MIPGKRQSVNTKQMLMCVLLAFKEFGIDYIQAQDFINAKEDKQQENDNLLRLLFDLSLLHMFDYDIDLKSLNIKASEADMIAIVLVHLIESECPLLIDLEEGGYQGLNFESSRILVLVIGWIMAVSDFFGHVGEYIVKKAFKKERPLYLQSQTTHHKKQKLNTQRSLSILCKSIRVTLSNINNLKKKKIKLAEKISSILKQAGQTISISEFLSNDPQRDIKQYQKLKKLVVFIQSQKTYMRFRSHFWAWIESIIKKDKQSIQDHPDYQFEEQTPAITHLTYNPNSLQNFMDQMDSSKILIEEYMPIFLQISEIFSIRQSKSTQSQKKQMQTLSKVVQSELNKTLPDYYPNLNPQAANSFIGIQLNQMFYKGEEDNQEGKQKKKQQGEAYEKAVELCKANMQNLSSLKFI